MTSEAPHPSGKRIQQDSSSVVTGDGLPTGKRVHNISVQTGEEFSLEFLQDRGAPRRVPIMHDSGEDNTDRGGINFNQNYQLRYEDLTGILGLRRIDSGCGSEASDYSSGKGRAAEVENKVYFDQASRYHKEVNGSGQRSEKSSDEMDFDRVSRGPIPPPLPFSESPQAYPLNASGVLDDFQYGKMKFLCSFGGKILPRPSDGKLRYVGGETRIISIKKNLSWEELVKKTSAICNQPHTIKYQLPGEDLDALISVSSDEDLLNMIEEYHGLQRIEGSQRLRIFLISSSESDSPCSQHSNSEYQYVVAVNGILDPTPRKSSSGQSLVGQSGHNMDGAPSFLRDSPTALHPLEIKEGMGSPNMMGVFSRPAAQFFLVSQNPTKSPNQSPPFSPLPVQKRESKTIQMQLHDDQLGHGSNESNGPFTTDQPPDNYCIDASGYFHPPHGHGPLMNYHHPSKHMVGVEQTNRTHGVHFHNRRPSRDFSPPVFVRNASDLEGYYCERPILKERANSERFPLHPEDRMGMFSGSNDSVGSHYGMPHARSDTQLQERGESSIYCLREGVTPSSPLDFETMQSPPWVNLDAIQGNSEFTNEFQMMLPGTDSTGCSQRRVDSPSSSCCPEFSSRNQIPHCAAHCSFDKYQMFAEDMNDPKFMSQEGYKENPGLSHEMLNLIDQKDACMHHGNHCQNNIRNTPHATGVDYKNKMPGVDHHPSSVFGVHGYPQELQVPGDNIATSSGIAQEPPLDIMADRTQGYQLEKSTSELLLKSPVIPNDQLCTPSEPTNGEAGYEVNNVLTASSVPWSRNTEVETLENGLRESTNQKSNDKNSLTDLLCDSSLLPFECQTEMGDQARMVTTSVNLAPFSTRECADSSLNLRTDDLNLTWSSELLVKSPTIPNDQLCTPSEPTNGEPGYEVNNVLTASSVPWSRNTEVETLENARRESTNRQSNHGNSLIDLQCESSLLPFECQTEMGDQERMVTTSVNLAPFSIGECADSTLNLQTDELNLTWSSYQNPATDDPLKREVTLLDEDPVNFPGEEVDHEVNLNGPLRTEDDIHLERSNNLDKNIQLESVIIVEDVTDIMPPDHESSKVVPCVLYTSEDISSPRITESESIAPESEDTKLDSDMDDSISDSVIAEIEAGIYGLQIIRNVDLEELSELGSGTFGTVYHGKWRGTDVAIKRIKKSCFAGRSSEQERLTKDFWREAQILSNLHHPNVVAFYGVVPDGAGGTMATVTEFMVNGSLRHVLIRKDRTLDRRKRLIIAMDAAFGMEYLHSKNIVHFDLKCDNLLVNMRDSQRPVCKVGDFGLSRIKRNTLVSGGVRGTLPWMAPELLNGSSSRVSEKVDVFSFGIAMWEILTGDEPYANMHCGAIIGGIVNNSLRPPIPERCDPEWRKLMEQCWSPDPAARPSFTEITNRLRRMSLRLQTKGQR
ncbi:uncharacterized protein LOC122059610 [Macadamia integrifolia]|uniref:uncharacterized protein LOC122059610 n=1 Tax=Macadamia integrifolia TaxID=60698 RepID=UPI001C531046|nr:uncharacterized protein LOC122059610 [Macadamia integrifolia]XP_042478437.1 uncharacterized protein LOC122059610 [Macadamia integrifolia]XP_042478439.1 uncharacterized protein LOC122059610 [Macadamia integrifolia]